MVIMINERMLITPIETVGQRIIAGMVDISGGRSVIGYNCIDYGQIR